jgi:hypothetical protein
MAAADDGDAVEIAAATPRGRSPRLLGVGLASRRRPFEFSRAKLCTPVSSAALSRSSWARPPISVKPRLESVSAISVASLLGLSSRAMFREAELPATSATRFSAATSSDIHQSKRFNPSLGKSRQENSTADEHHAS